MVQSLLRRGVRPGLALLLATLAFALLSAGGLPLHACWVAYRGLGSEISQLLLQRRSVAMQATPVERRPGAVGNAAAGISSAVAELAAAAYAAGQAAARSETRAQLLAACAATCRGQCGSEAAREEVLQLVEALEGLNPTVAPARATDLLEGQWRLVYASEDVTRSSPFFWAWRQLLLDMPDPLPLTRSALGTETLSDSIFAITDAIPGKTIGEALQSLEGGRLVNRVELKVFGVGRTVMTTTCSYAASENDPTVLDLRVETTQPSDSSLPLADSVVFPSGELLGKSADVSMQVTYLDNDLRVSRNVADGQVFVYCRR